ncbi:SixA phosphatase family protein [Streptomyces polyrhachis]|uniref:SixA phosphatase family protein n=1 Tax=Streptomyces polyrhachis TaxID=1282885 RepID=A0ABW2GDU8_9ACTN
MVDNAALPGLKAGYRRLVVLRHAKSDWPEGVPDAKRPLAPRGRRDATAAGRWLRGHGCLPERVYCSPALRTRQTWELAAERLGDPSPSSSSRGYPMHAEYEPRLYHAEAEALLEVVHEVGRKGAKVRTLLLVGHNPELQELVLGLAGSGRGKLLETAKEKFPTAAIAVLDVKGDWRDLGWGTAKLRALAVPRGIRG